MLSKMLKKDHLEYEFLPAALEITETPPSPLGSFVIWGILILLFVAFLWSYFGRVDEVAVARGKVIPDGKLKVVQPVEEGVITAIHVEEGQRVKEGELLLELDSTIENVDVKSLEKALQTAKIEKEILNAELDGKDEQEVLKTNDLYTSDLSEEVIQFLGQLKNARESEYQSKENALLNVIKQREAELKSAELLLASFESKYSLLKTQEDSYKQLFESGAISKMEWMTKQNEAKTAEEEYESQKSTIVRFEESLNEANENLSSLKKEINTNLINQIVEKEKGIASIEAQLQKAQKLYEYQNILSPVNGTIHGLNANTIGGVVTPAQPIMTIVPDGTPLIVEGTVLNKDIGFIKVGQEVEIKLDTFPFQKYGTLKGEVLFISPDAFEEEKLGQVYKMKAKLEKSSLVIDGNDVNISPGMTVSAEIKTGQRRIIEFFLEPIIKYAKESITLR